jgi:adenylate cyclase
MISASDILKADILIVDDQEVNVALLEEMLRRAGYVSITSTMNPHEVCQLHHKNSYALILLDLHMPGLNGFQVLKALKEIETGSYLPVLVQTSQPSHLLRALVAGAKDFVSKPFNLAEVLLRVHNMIEVRLLHRESERLLLNMLPKAIVERMKQGETNIADLCPDTTVLVADLVGFTTLSARIDPQLVVQLLNEIFSAFDLLTEKHGLEKIKTFGDAYMAAGGISVPRPDHAEAIAELAIDLRSEVERYNRQNNNSFRLRIGICSGPVVAGVIGHRKFAYDLWGETVNLACRLESTAEAGKIQISESSYEYLKDTYHIEEKHSIIIPGQNDLPAYGLGNPIGRSALIGANGKVEL